MAKKPNSVTPPPADPSVADRLAERPTKLGSASVGNIVSNNGEALTTNQGVRIGDNQNSLKLGQRGPSLLEDFILREKITHFDHERIPERVVHARGAGAHGYFEVYESMAAVTQAGFLCNPGVKTPVFVRFSTVAGSRGSADMPRDVRGFAVKFYTQEGNFDLVGNNIPVFFIQDAIKFPDFVHAVKPEPHHEMPQAASAHDTFWDYVSLQPETMHMVLWVMSDRGIPRSLSMMEGFGVHTFRLVNAAGESQFVKFHWKPLLGAHSVVWDEALKINGKDPDFARRDLFEAIENGNFPEWELGVQLIPETDEHKFGFDLLDPTKLVPEELVPVQRIGKMVLNRNPDNYFAETEQVAFHPGHVVPGIDFTDDPLLQGRLFSYTDTQLIRLGGPNSHEIPINRAQTAVHNNQRDGYMRQTIVPGRTAYEPNSLGGGFPNEAGPQGGGFVSYPESAEESAVKLRKRADTFNDHFSQATLFWNSQTPVERQHIVDAYTFELGKVEVAEIRSRTVGQLSNIAQELAARVAEQLGIAVEPIAPLAPARDQGVSASPALSLMSQPMGSIKGRKIAVLTADGVSAEAVERLRTAALKGGASVKIIGPRASHVLAGDGSSLAVDHALPTVGSVLFDAVYVPDGAGPALAGVAAAKLFIAESYKHYKAVGASGDGAVAVRAAADGALPSDDPAGFAGQGVVLDGEAAANIAAFLEAVGRHRSWQRDNAVNVVA
jgi:catalase